MRPATDLVIPVKPLASAKTRLFGAARSGADDRAAHQELVLALAMDTATAALATPGVRTVLVISADLRVRQAVATLGASVLDEEFPRGLNAALTHGARLLRERDPSGVVGALQADLPALRCDDLANALNEADGRRAFCADRTGAGTTLLLGASGAELNPLFGRDSAGAHERSAAAGITAPVPTLRCDVDTAQDLSAAAELGLGKHTAASPELFRSRC
jgi:2-phospho-L-lactate guanylyltransferase